MNKQIENIWAEAAPKKEELTKVELALFADVEKKLGSANSKRKKLQTQAMKVINGFKDLQSEYNDTAQMAKRGENQAKELGLDPAEKAFKARGDEAKDFEGSVGSAYNKMKGIISAI